MNDTKALEQKEFDGWWYASKYCQVVSPEAHWKQIALDGWQAARQSQAAQLSAAQARLWNLIEVASAVYSNEEHAFSGGMRNYKKGSPTWQVYEDLRVALANIDTAAQTLERNHDNSSPPPQGRERDQRVIAAAEKIRDDARALLNNIRDNNERSVSFCMSMSNLEDALAEYDKAKKL